MIKYADVLEKCAALKPSTKSNLEGFKAGAKEYAKYLWNPSNWNKARNTAVNSMLRGAINIPGTIAAGIAGPVPGLGGPGLGGALAHGWQTLVTDNLLPKSRQRKELEAISPGLKTVNNLVQDATGTAILAAKAPYGTYATEHTHGGTPYQVFNTFPGWGSPAEVAGWVGGGNAAKTLTIGRALEPKSPAEPQTKWQKATQWVADHL